VRDGATIWIRNICHLDTHRAWLSEEDDRLTQLQGKYGNKWSMISKIMTDRSENDVKNRYNTLTADDGDDARKFE
jgi:hypothetical protein